MPENVIGICPWCGRDNVNLYIVTGFTQIDGPFGQYVCGRCKSMTSLFRDKLPVEDIIKMVVRTDA